MRDPLLSSSSAFLAATKNHATSTYNMRGADLVDSRVFIHDTTGGLLRQSTDWGATFSSGKGVPTNVTGIGGIGKMVRFGAYLYGACIDTASGLAKISRTLPQPGNTAFSWTDVFTSPAGVVSFLGPCLNAGSQYLFWGTYSDPSAGAAIYRSADGVAWSVVYGPDASIRHCHAVAEDPYNAGHIYATMGDGIAKTIVRSTDHGDNWTTIVASSSWQGVQISFDSKWVWFAHDSSRMTAMIMNRSTLVPYVAALNYHWHIPVPGAAVVTNRFYRNAFWGAVDPTTGIYYCTPNDTSGAGNTNGLMYIAQAGSDVRLLDDAPVAGEVFIAGGYVWAGQYHRALLVKVDAA